MKEISSRVLNVNNLAVPEKGGLFFLLTAVVAVFSVLMLFTLKNKTDDKKTFTAKAAAVAIVSVVCDVLILVRNYPARKSISFIILLSILAYASLSDILSQTADNFLPVLILVTGFIGTDSITAIRRIGAGSVLLALLIGSSFLFGKRSLGGADIKIICSQATVLGLTGSLVSLAAGLLIGVITMTVLHRLKKYEKGKPFALIPFISVGSAMVILI